MTAEDTLEDPLVRPYALVLGRARPARDLPLESLLTCGDPVGDTVELCPEQRLILLICRTPTAVAELSAALALPLGVTQVLIHDLLALGLLRLGDTQVAGPMLQRVLAGLRRLPG